MQWKLKQACPGGPCDAKNIKHGLQFWIAPKFMSWRRKRKKWQFRATGLLVVCLGPLITNFLLIPFSFPPIGFHDRSVGRKKVLALILLSGVCHLWEAACNIEIQAANNFQPWNSLDHRQGCHWQPSKWQYPRVPPLPLNLLFGKDTFWSRRKNLERKKNQKFGEKKW